MIPAFAFGDGSSEVKRFAWIYIPNGVVQDAWHPSKCGSEWEVTPSLAPLEAFREQVNVYTGLDREFRGGTGVHAQAGCCWLTSSPPSEALDGGFPTNISLDQLIARKVCQDTLLPSLELSCNDHTNQKETKYFETISWHGPGYAARALKDPAEVFRRLFGRPDPSTRNVLDAVREDAARLRLRLGAADRDKLDEYFDSVRGIEQRIQKLAGDVAGRAQSPPPEPTGIPEDRGGYIRLMCDLVVAAFQQDRTRVATLLIDPERWDTPRLYHGLFDSPQNHHVLTHTKGEEAKAKLRQIDRFHVSQFAYLLRRLQETTDAGGRLLDSSLITLGSGMGDGRVHDYNNLPVVTAGSLGGRFPTGQHYTFDGKTPLGNLWLSMLRQADPTASGFADSTGTLM
jgi:hypothetical protein